MTGERGLHRSSPMAGFALLLALVGVVLAVPSMALEGGVLLGDAWLQMVCG